MTLTVGEQTFRLEFRYVTKLGKRAQLHRGPIKAVTTAVLIAGAPRFRTAPLVAIDNALCSEADNFSRTEGRMRAFKKLLEHCGALRDMRGDLWEEFSRRFSPDGAVLIPGHAHGPQIARKARIRPKPTPEQVAEFKAVGAAKHLQRQQARGGAA
jgi:hypothetical protein